MALIELPSRRPRTHLESPTLLQYKTPSFTSSDTAVVPESRDSTVDLWRARFVFTEASTRRSSTVPWASSKLRGNSSKQNWAQAWP